MSGKVEAWRIEALAQLAPRTGTGGKKVPLAWKASLASVADERVVVHTVLKAWPGLDAAGVKVGNLIRAERREYLPPDGGSPKVSYMVVSPKAVRAIEAKESQEERLATMERRIAHLEEFMKRLLRDRTEASERRLGGNPDARREGKGEGPSEEYLRTMADPERKMPLVPSGSLA